VNPFENRDGNTCGEKVNNEKEFEDKIYGMLHDMKIFLFKVIVALMCLPFGVLLLAYRYA